jgi:hypothetical protein
MWLHAVLGRQFGRTRSRREGWEASWQAGIGTACSVAKFADNTTPLGPKKTACTAFLARPQLLHRQANTGAEDVPSS